MFFSNLSYFYPPDISSEVFPPNPQLGLCHGPTAKFTVPPDPHLHCGRIFYCFSWNITFENSIFIQKWVNPREFNDKVIHINCKFVDFLLKPTLKSLYVRRRLPGQQKFTVQLDGVHYHTTYSVTKYLNENDSNLPNKYRNIQKSFSKLKSSNNNSYIYIYF